MSMVASNFLNCSLEMLIVDFMPTAAGKAWNRTLQVLFVVVEVKPELLEVLRLVLDHAPDVLEVLRSLSLHGEHAFADFFELVVGVFVEHCGLK